MAGMISTIKVVLLLSAAVIGLAQGSPAEFTLDDVVIAPRAEPDLKYRLPDDVKPLKYEVQLTPYFEATTDKDAFTFDGKVIITLQATKPGVRAVVLHVHDLENCTYAFSGSYGSGSMLENQYDNVTDKWTIPVLVNDLSQSPTGTTLTIEYRGYLRDDMNGFYRSYYYENKNKVFMASTQFQQTEARRAFPCFDEPGFKAPFQLTMVRPRDMNTLTNTRRLTMTDLTVAGQLKTAEVFDWTPPMSTYLLAFIVSKYDGQNNTANDFGVYARPEAKAQVVKALNFGYEMLNEFGKYLGINYYDVQNVTKMDMAAIPDFSAGAMENWGLLTYRETNILYYPDDTPSLNEQRIVAVIAHEQAHMWFGDLLTCKWWSETWLNEGFARYFQFFGTKMISAYADWDLEEQFVVENLQQSMQLDSTDDTHAMTDPSVSTKAQASKIFDNISYNKASSIIRMLSHYITLAKFQTTLQLYLDKNRFEAVEPANLFTAINEMNPGDGEVVRFWAPWTSTPGFPLVTVSVTDAKMTLKQKRFMRTGITHDKTEVYNIPITYVIDSENYDSTTPKFVFRMEDGSAEKTFDLEKKPTKYIILNTKQTGYYRVNYDENNWNQIKEALRKDNFDGIHVMNRAQIVDDLFNLARAGIVKYSPAVDIIRYIKKEKHYIPWLSAISHGLTFLSQRVSGQKNQEVFSWFILDTLDEVYNHLKFDAQVNDRRTDIYNRVNILTWACRYGHQECIKSSKALFESFMKGTSKVPKNHRSTVYCNAVRHGNGTEFNFLYDRYMDQDISAEQLNFLIGMGCTKDAALVKKYLDRITDGDQIRPQDRSAAINNILNSNDEGPDFLFKHVTENHAKWRTTMGNLNTLETVAGRFTTNDQFSKYQTWLETQKTNLGDSYDSLSKSMATAKATNLAWDDKYMKEFMEHLSTLKSSAPVKVISILISAISLVVLYLFN